MRAMMLTPILEVKINALIKPICGCLIFLAKYIIAMHNKTAPVVVTKRAANAVNPKTEKLKESSQYKKGGFSIYGTQFKYGITNDLLSSICFAILAYSPSLLSKRG